MQDGRSLARRVRHGAWRGKLRNKRQIRKDYRDAGFIERQGKGDHTVFSYPGLPKHYAVDGSDGADARPYDERNLRAALQAQAETHGEA